MITRCCKWLCHEHSNDEKLDTSHLGVIAGLHLSLVKNDNGSVFTPESASLLLAVILHSPGVPGTAILALSDFLRTLLPGFLCFRRKNN